jgi:hypothetical protein
MQEFFWALLFEDGTSHLEYNPNGETNSYNEITPEMRKKAIYFGLTSAVEGYFFDLKTGEYHYRNQSRDEKKTIAVPFGTRLPIPITGPLRNGEKYEFYQYKAGHTDFNMALQSGGNVIDSHTIGYKVVKRLAGKPYFIDVNIVLDVSSKPVKPLFKVTLRDKSEEGPLIGTYTIVF